MSAIVFKNCALIVNQAEHPITIEKDSNFDDMIVVVDGVRRQQYELPAGHAAYVGATYSEDGPVTYSDDMGLMLAYHGDERYMEVGVQKETSAVFVVISDSEEGDANAPLSYTVTDQTPTSITLTFSDNSPAR